MNFEDLKNNSDLRLEFLKEYSILSGREVCSSCSSKLLEYFNHYQKLKAMSETTKFKFKDDSVRYVPSKHLHVSNKNLSDELALELLKSSKAYINHFSHYPNNWEAMLEEYRGLVNVPLEAINVPIEDEADLPQSPGASEKPDIDYPFILTKIKGIGANSAKKIGALHPTVQSLLNAAEKGEDTGVHKNFNPEIINLLGN